MNVFILWFYKITVWPFIVLFYRPRVYIHNKTGKKPNVRGTILISNHYSVYDVPFIINTFFFRTIYFISGEVLYKKRMLAWWITTIGAIRVNRDQKDVSWFEKSEKLLRKGKTILIFPQSKLSPNNNNEYKQAFAVLASKTKAPIVSLYVSGNYSFKNRASMVIGEKTDIDTMWNLDKNYRDNIEEITSYFEEYNKELQLIHEKKQA